uniref:NACHT domain-containing protein n=1 Tax=Pundamilia nyererei TaxID=303518 RepID=A0A3B4H3G1_9CICH
FSYPAVSSFQTLKLDYFHLMFLFHPETLQACHLKLNSNLKQKFQCVFEGIPKAGNPTLLNEIYTELYITEGGTAEVNDEHEVRQIEIASRKPDRPETTIRQEDIFKLPPGRKAPVRTVLTMGVAGIGKTVLTQKFTLDWAEDKANQDIQFMFPFTFRELNVLKEEKFSLVGLVHHFFTETKEAGICSFEDFQVVFIFDGLDECRLPLDFHKTTILTDPRESTSVDVLLINLIRGKLLPSARLWITTRPAAANQIPPDCVGSVTEVRGFTDPQKEEYFRKRFRDEEQASRIISHIKTSRSLHIMCHIPVFCWITATVLEFVMKNKESEDLPKTLTELYLRLVLFHLKTKNIKCDKATDPHWSPESRKMIESLGKLAFDQLQKGNLIFYESDLTECGIDIRAASVYSGVFTQIFKADEYDMFSETVYCFVHLSIQEFLAAVYMFHYWEHKTEVLENFSKNGHLDLFVRFLHGLSLESNQRLLGGLLGQTESSPGTIQRVIKSLKKMNSDKISPDRSINIFHCLMEMNDLSVHQEIQEFLKSENRSKKLSEIHCSALAFMLQMSEDVLDELDLKKYNTSVDGQRRLIPAVRNCRKARLRWCGLSESHFQCVTSALKSNTSSLIQLDLSGNTLDGSELKLLCAGLKSPNCKLDALRSVHCLQLLVTIRLQGSCLFKKFKISFNLVFKCGDQLTVQPSLYPNFWYVFMCELDALLSISGEISCQKNLFEKYLLRKICCCVFDIFSFFFFYKLRLRSCSLSEISCVHLGSALKSNPSHLKHLDLTGNELQDSGVKQLCSFLESPHCTLEYLRFDYCGLSDISCLVSALKSKPSHLRDLNLSNNYLQDSGVKQLCGFLESPGCKLETLRSVSILLSCGLSKISCNYLAAALKSNPSHLRELDLCYNDLQNPDLSELVDLQESLDYRLETLQYVNCWSEWVVLSAVLY